jgi:3-hydroxymyristoyl/3-hydroxydecanoyl-(acyl carrier protein) dehydratase
MPRDIPGPYDPAEMRRFLETFNYREEAFLVDEVVKIDPEARAIEARMDTTRELPFTRHQRVDDSHPAHVNAGELLQITGSLGCLHAWFFHGCRWEEGWAGFGCRIHRADFKDLARLGPPLQLESRETRTRVGPKRIVMRCELRFWQEETLVYFGDQTAMFLKDPTLGS